MKLRTQVLLAVLLMLLVPLGAVFVLLSTRNGGSVPGQALLRYVFLANWIKGNITEGPDGLPLLRPRLAPFDQTEIVVFDGAGNVIAHLPEALPTRSDIFSGDRRFFWQSLNSRGRVFGSVLVRFPPNHPGVPEDPLDPLDWLSVYLALLVITAVVLAVWLGRLSTQVSRLRRATEDLIRQSWEQPLSFSGLVTVEFRDLGAAFESLRQGLVSEQQKRARFLAAVSHDLRTPLTSILGYVEALEDGLAEDPETRHRYLSIVRTKAELLGGRLSDLIDYGRMEAEDWKPVRVAQDLVEFLEELCAVLEDDGRLRGVSLLWSLLPRGSVRVSFDRALVTRALENLVNNAFQVCPSPGGQVYLALTSTAGGWVLSVEDNGPGIGSEDQSFVFEPFFRGSGPRKPGHGLGLFIARTILAGHGWNLTLEPSPQGARFAVLVPSE